VLKARGTTGSGSGGIEGEHTEQLARAEVMLVSIIQIKPLVKGLRCLAGPESSLTDCMRTIDRRITQLMTVWGHGALPMPSQSASTCSTRETARKLRWARAIK